MKKAQQEKKRSPDALQENNTKDTEKSTDKYKKMGFKCGLEIHQQLDTHNLFCACPSIVHDTHPQQVATRRLRAVVGETGSIDAAASHEQEKGLEFVYDACEKSHCLVELDEEPPQPINKDAVEIALIVCKMLHCEIVDEIQIMRKTVIDGSNVSGFQRTALIGMDGYIETSQGKVYVPTVCLEEEAAKRIRGTADKQTHFRLDRLGVCLLEIATDASIKTPEHAQECAEQLGMILRSTKRVKRGIGTIRQDVNVSIKGGVRVEIKGFQELRSIPAVIQHEVARQSKAIEKKTTLVSEVRKAEPDNTTSFLRPMPGAARMYPETDVLPITITKKWLDTLNIPILLSEQKKVLQEKYKLEAGVINDIIKRNIDIEKYVQKHPQLEPKFIAATLTQTTTEIVRKEKIPLEAFSDEVYDEVLEYANSGKITKDAVGEVLVKKTKGEKINLSEYATISDAEIEKAVAQLIKEKPGLNMGGYMGLLMAKFKGKIDGKKASAAVGKMLR